MMFCPYTTQRLRNTWIRYPVELEIKDTTESNTSASYLKLLLSIGRDGQLHTSIYDKRDDFNFHITNFSYLRLAIYQLRPPCYVAVFNNYAICNTLQTALNCNTVCNTSYFKLRCEGNAICNVLQIASKFYHLKILKRRKKLINCKMHRFVNNILL